MTVIHEEYYARVVSFEIDASEDSQVSATSLRRSIWLSASSIGTNRNFNCWPPGGTTLYTSAVVLPVCACNLSLCKNAIQASMGHIGPRLVNRYFQMLHLSSSTGHECPS